jgi:hypothetical protein
MGSSASQGAAAGGMGAFAGFAQMAAMMGDTGNTDVVRVHGKRATIQTEPNGNKKLILSLSGGAILTVNQLRGEVSAEDLEKTANAFDIKAMEKYLKAE